MKIVFVIITGLAFGNGLVSLMKAEWMVGALSFLLAAAAFFIVWKFYRNRP